MGTLKGKLAIKLFKSYPKMKEKPYWGNHFWSRGYFVSTIGIDEEMIKRYVKYQEGEEKKEETQTKNFDLFNLPPSESHPWGLRPLPSSPPSQKVVVEFYLKEGLRIREKC